MSPTTSHARPRVRLSAPDAWRGAVSTALGCAGVAVDPEAAVGVAVARARTVPPEVDDWVVDSTPHVLVAVWPHAHEVGPWVLPGTGPCARCVAAGTLDDGGRGLPGAADLDPAWLALTAGWVARDVRQWLRGDTPVTWGASWLLGADAVPVERSWRRHPYCGCAWWDTA